MNRSEAKSSGLRRYSSGIACKNGHIAERFTSTGGCVECIAAWNKAWKKENPEKARPTKAAAARYYQKHKEKIMRKRAEKRPSLRDIENLRQRERRERDPGKFAAYVASYRSSRFNATPDWLTVADKAEIEGMYHFASVMKRMTGADFHVDHIVPLQGKVVTGLHVPWNMRVITGLENRRKSNKFLSELLTSA